MSQPTSTGWFGATIASAGGGGEGNEQIKGGKGADLTAANQMALGNDGNYFLVNGNTQIQHLSTDGWTAGSVIYLQFASNPLVKDEAAAPPAGYAQMELSGDADFQASIDDTLTLAYDGTSWREIARTAI